MGLGEGPNKIIMGVARTTTAAPMTRRPGLVILDSAGQITRVSETEPGGEDVDIRGFVEGNGAYGFVGERANESWLLRFQGTSGETCESSNVTAGEEVYSYCPSARARFYSALALEDGFLGVGGVGRHKHPDCEGPSEGDEEAAGMLEMRSSACDPATPKLLLLTNGETTDGAWTGLSTSKVGDTKWEPETRLNRAARRGTKGFAVIGTFRDNYPKQAANLPETLDRAWVALLNQNLGVLPMDPQKNDKDNKSWLVTPDGGEKSLLVENEFPAKDPVYQLNAQGIDIVAVDDGSDDVIALIYEQITEAGGDYVVRLRRLSASDGSEVAKGHFVAPEYDTVRPVRLIKVPGDGYLVAADFKGAEDRIGLIRFDECLNSLWYRTYPVAELGASEAAVDVMLVSTTKNAAAEPGVLLLGTTRSTESGVSQIRLIRTGVYGQDGCESEGACWGDSFECTPGSKPDECGGPPLSPSCACPAAPGT